MNTNGYDYQNQVESATADQAVRKQPLTAEDFLPGRMSSRLLRLAQIFKLISYVLAGLFVLGGILDQVMKVDTLFGRFSVWGLIGLIGALVSAAVVLLLGQLIASILTVQADRQEKTDIMLRLAAAAYRATADEAGAVVVEEGLSALEQRSAAKLQQVQLVFQFTPGEKPATAYGYGAPGYGGAPVYGAPGYGMPATPYGQEAGWAQTAYGQTPTVQNYAQAPSAYPQGQPQSAYGQQPTYGYGQASYGQEQQAYGQQAYTQATSGQEQPAYGAPEQGTVDEAAVTSPKQD